MTLAPDRRHAEAAETQARWDLAMQCAGFGIWDLDVPGQAVVYSPAWKHLLGYADEAGADSTAVWRSRVHADDLEAMLAALQACIGGAGASGDGSRAVVDDYEHEFRMHDAHGTWRSVLSRGRVVARDAQGRALRMIGTLTDLSDRRRADALRLQLDREQARNRARTDFLARMSHELRTPLNAVLGYAQLLQPMIGGADTDLQRSHLHQVEQAGWALLKLIEETLEMAEADKAQGQGQRGG